jgi:hypothetical protein
MTEKVDLYENAPLPEGMWFSITRESGDYLVIKVLQKYAPTAQEDFWGWLGQKMHLSTDNRVVMERTLGQHDVTDYYIGQTCRRLSLSVSSNHDVSKRIDKYVGEYPR